MVCLACGQEISDSSKFCEKCGHKIPRCPTCGSVIFKRIRFCINDGTALTEDILSLIPAETAQPARPADAEGVSPAADAVIERTGIGKPEDHDEAEIHTGMLPGAGAELAFALKSEADPRPIAEPGNQRFCVRCGTPCEDGRTLCASCRSAQRMQMVLDNEPHKAEPKKKRRLVPVLLMIIAALIVSAVGVFGYFIINDSLSDSQNNLSGSDGPDHAAGTSDGAEAASDGDASEVHPEDDDNERPGAAGQDAQTPPAGQPPEEGEDAGEPAAIVYEHTYEVIAGDLTWEEAVAACEAKGGYLAVVTSEDEYAEISKLATDSGLTFLWLGASLHAGAETWGNGSWITGEDWSFEKWYPGEPSGEDSDGTKEYCLCLWNAKYDGEELGWTFNDQRNDLIGAFPSMSGKVGYICEYEIQIGG